MSRVREENALERGSRSDFQDLENERTHNPLVPGSNPGGPTNVFKRLQRISVQLDFFRLRPGCRRLRICFSIELINPGNIGARDQMSVGIDGHLYRAVAHLLLHVRKAGARLNQMRCVTMAQCVKRDSPQAFRALGIEFLSLCENVDTSTPTGKMVFTVLASVSELEKSIIAERVRAGLRNAKSKGTRLGRPPLKSLTVEEVQQLRRERRRSKTSFKTLAVKYGISVWSAFELCKKAKA